MGPEFEMETFFLAKRTSSFLKGNKKGFLCQEKNVADSCDPLNLKNSSAQKKRENSHVLRLKK